MKSLVALATVTTGFLLSAGQLFAAGMLPAGCGAENVQFKVKTEKAAASLGNAPAAKAQVIFVETLDGEFSSGPVSRFAIDGKWIGATKGASYFDVLVDPGSHQICASRQSAIKLERENLGTLDVQMQAGQTYVYQFTIQRNTIGHAEMHAAGAGVPGSSMTAKDPETVDTASLTAPVGPTATAALNKLPRAVAVTK